MKNSKPGKCFRDKTVLITGHTGFKGSWLSIWLEMLGARVVGISDKIPTSPSNFEASGVAKIVKDHRCNLGDYHSLEKIIKDTKPNFVFHLAAQALVVDSYSNPLETFQTNVMGSANILESLRNLENSCVLIMITSDKCYDNVEWEWGYRENDRLGGKDPYSASKGAAELIIRSYLESFYQDSGIRIGICRAGNVIGGGDWAANRLVPDCMRSWFNNEVVTIKNPESTRPWQLVLEPLSGYMALAMALHQSDSLHGEAFNFGPLAENNYSVKQLIEEMQRHSENVNWQLENSDKNHIYEAGLLKLNCDKAFHKLSWRPTYSFHETVAATMAWYKEFYQGNKRCLDISRQEIIKFQQTAKNKEIVWAA